MSAWVYPNAAANYRAIMTDATGTGGGAGARGTFVIRVISDDKVDAVVWQADTGTPRWIRTSGGLPEDQWVHVVLVSEDYGTDLSLYFNGVEQAPAFDQTTGFGQSTGGDAFKIGSNEGKAEGGGDGYLSFDGLIDEIGIWSATLTVEEIEWLCNNSAGDLLAPPPLPQGTGIVLR